MITRMEIAQGLRTLGLTTGDIVLLHSSLASMGHVEGGAEAVVDAFLDVLGPEGTLVVPIFEPGLGIITEVVKARQGAVCSIHPWACVAAVGRDAEELCREHWKAPLAHTENTPYMRIADKGGYVCLLGVDQDRSTTLHTVEALLRLPYLQETQPVTFDTPEGKVTQTWPFFPGPHRDFIGLDPALRASGRMRMRRIGDAVVRLMRSRDLIDVTLELGRKDPAFVLCDNPNCPDCVPQRAALRREAEALSTGCVRCTDRDGPPCTCPLGIDVRQVMLLSRYRAQYGLLPAAELQWSTIAEAAKRCDECGHCEERCPAGLRIIPSIHEAAIREAAR